MELTIGTIKVDHYIQLIIKRRWLVIIPLLFTLIIGLVLSVILPRAYSTNTLILVQPPRVPANYVRSLVSEDLSDRVSTISQQIMSRTNLEKIINEFDLYSDPKYAGMYHEDKLESLRKRISVRVTRARGGMDAFSISFKGQDPDKIVQVADALAAFFIDENLKVREAHAVGTESFLEEELSSMRERLEQVEEAYKDYRTNYMGELPEQLPTNLRILDRLQEQLRIKEERLSQAHIQLSEIDAQQRTLVTTAGDIGVTSASPELTQLIELRQQLLDLNTRYTDQHPDIIRHKLMIKELEEKIRSGKIEFDSGEAVIQTHQNRDRQMELQRNKANTLNEIGTLKTDIDKIRSELKTINQRVEDTPKREQELMSLRRDYNNIQDSYNSLLNRKLEAEIAVNMERKQKGEQFRILDAAKKPERADSPNVAVLLMGSIAAGLGLGIGIILLIDYLDTSIRYKDEMESLTGLPVLSAVPEIEKKGDQLKKKINWWLTCAFLGIEAMLFGLFVLFALKGVDKVLAFADRLIAM